MQLHPFNLTNHMFVIIPYIALTYMNIFILFSNLFMILITPINSCIGTGIKDLWESALHTILLNNRLHWQQYLPKNFKSFAALTYHRCNNRTNCWDRRATFTADRGFYPFNWQKSGTSFGRSGGDMCPLLCRHDWI